MGRDQWANPNCTAGSLKKEKTMTDKNKTNFKIGNRVSVKYANPGVYKTGEITGVQESPIAGQDHFAPNYPVFTVKLDEPYQTASGNIRKELRSSFRYLKSIEEKSTGKISPVCCCNIRDLMADGCKCGGR